MCSLNEAEMQSLNEAEMQSLSEAEMILPEKTLPNPRTCMPEDFHRFLKRLRPSL
ncbi:MAG: hypothetical protein II563_07845 [Treponema sp.]|nr:hypothetical protein [Treponema sp.]